MRTNQIGFETTGSSDVLRTYSRDILLGNHDVLVETKFVGINMGDVIRRKRGGVECGIGHPFIPGFEGVGRVVEASSEHADLLGKSIAFLTPFGAYTTHIALNRFQIFVLPDSFEFEPQLAGLICTGLTAWMILQSLPNDFGGRILVPGAAGGVSSILLQLLRERNIFSLGLVSSDVKASLARKNGATMTLTCAETPFNRDLPELKADEFEAVADGVGESVLGVIQKVLKPNGRWIVYGTASGSSTIMSADLIRRRHLMQGILVFDLLADPHRLEEGYAFLIRALSNNVLKSDTTICEASQVGAIHSQIEDRTLVGRAVMDVSTLCLA